MTRVMLVLVAVLLALPTLAVAQSIEGAWRLEEFESANLPSPAETPGLMILADGRYSRVFVRGREPRQPIGPDATPAEQLASWNPFIANSGTYTLEGSTLTLDIVVAKVAGVMGTSTTVEVEFDGDALLLTGDIEGATSSRQRWVRVN